MGQPSSAPGGSLLVCGGHDDVERDRAAGGGDLLAAALQPERPVAGGLSVAALWRSDQWSVLNLIDVLLGLGPTEAERRQARAILLAAIPGTSPKFVQPLVEAVCKLGPTDAERDDLRAMVLRALPNGE